MAQQAWYLINRDFQLSQAFLLIRRGRGSRGVAQACEVGGRIDVQLAAGKRKTGERRRMVAQKVAGTLVAGEFFKRPEKGGSK